MPTIRRSSNTKFKAISRQLLQDNSLSFDVRGMLAYLLSKPDDWECRPAELARAGGIGRDKCRGMIIAAEKAGYITFGQGRGEHGHFTAAYTVHEEPVPEDQRTQSWTHGPGRFGPGGDDGSDGWDDNDSPLTENPSAASNPPLTENPSAVNASPLTEKPLAVEPLTVEPLAVDQSAYMNREVQNRDLQKRDPQKRDISAPSLRSGAGAAAAPGGSQAAEGAKPLPKAKSARKAKPAAPPADPRHAAFTRIYFSSFRMKYQVDPAWNGRQGKAMSELLARVDADFDAERFAGVVANWMVSARGNGDFIEFCRYFPALLNGPVDQYGNPMSQAVELRTNGKVHSSAGGDEFVAKTMAKVRERRQRAAGDYVEGEIVV